MPLLLAIFFSVSAYAQTYHYKGTAVTSEVNIEKKIRHTVYSKVVVNDSERVFTSTHCSVEVLPSCKMSTTKIRQVPGKGWAYIDGRHTCSVTLNGTIKDLKEMVCAEKLPNGNTLRLTYRPSPDKQAWTTIVKNSANAELGSILMVLTGISEQDYNKALRK